MTYKKKDWSGIIDGWESNQDVPTEKESKPNEILTYIRRVREGIDCKIIAYWDNEDPNKKYQSYAELHSSCKCAACEDDRDYNKYHNWS